jgi:hypothetical protein
MSTFLLVSDHAGHNILGLGLLLGASSVQWVLGERLGPQWDCSNVLVEPGGWSCWMLQSDDLWAWSEHEVHGG